MDKDLLKLERKFEKQLAKAQADKDSADLALNTLVSDYETTKSEIIAYYDALAKKIEADTIITKGLPVI
jgi:hypothetical protein